MINKKSLYPLKFHPILKEKVWGGQKLVNLFGKKASGNIGESWEISGLDNNTSIVSNGMLQGRTLNEIIEIYRDELVGKKVFKNFGLKFPLLFKFIDANQDLSVQVHPNDLLAEKRHNSFGKTEMWYIMATEEMSGIILGFKDKINQIDYLNNLSENTLTEILHFEKVSEGDSYFIEPGTVHAIGAGVLLAEIQQTSDITYRIYDYDRPDIDGKPRVLHTDLAVNAINFKISDAKVKYSKIDNEIVQLCSNPYFETNKLVLTENFNRNKSSIDSFMVYMCVEGDLIFESPTFCEVLSKGETLLIPASVPSFLIKTSSATILEIYIP